MIWYMKYVIKFIYYKFIESSNARKRRVCDEKQISSEAYDLSLDLYKRRCDFWVIEFNVLPTRCRSYEMSLPTSIVIKDRVSGGKFVVSGDYIPEDRYMGSEPHVIRCIEGMNKRDSKFISDMTLDSIICEFILNHEDEIVKLDSKKSGKSAKEILKRIRLEHKTK